MNKGRKELSGMWRDYVWNLEDGVEYELGYGVGGGEVESRGCGVREEGWDGVVGVKWVEGRKYVIVDDGEGEGGNVGREV